MNDSKLIAYISSSLLAVLSSQAQGTFQNLDFEHANPISAGVPDEPFIVTAASALPYWSVYYGNVQQTQILYNSIATGATSVSLISTSSSTLQPIDGTYSVLLQGGLTASAASISQTSLVPEGTQSLLFETEHPNSVSSGQLQVEIGTEVVPITAVGSGPNYTLYAANLSAWGGQTEQLTFSALEDLSGLNNWEIDDISFSPNAVPEPNSLVLTAVGGVLFAMCRRFLPNRR